MRGKPEAASAPSSAPLPSPPLSLHPSSFLFHRQPRRSRFSSLRLTVIDWSLLAYKEGISGRKLKLKGTQPPREGCRPALWPGRKTRGGRLSCRRDTFQRGIHAVRPRWKTISTYASDQTFRWTSRMSVIRSYGKAWSFGRGDVWVIDCSSLQVK